MGNAEGLNQQEFLSKPRWKGSFSTLAVVTGLLVSPGMAQATGFCDPIMLALGMCSAEDEAATRQAYQAMEARWMADFGFAISQSMAARLQQPTNRVALSSSNETGMAASAGGSRWTAWGSVAQTNLGYSFQPLRSSGHNDVILGGLDYTLANDVILGVAASIERTRITTSFNSGHLSSDGYSISPYIAIPINRSWIVDASLGWGRSTLDSTDNTGPTVTGKATDKRFSGSLSATYVTEIGNWQLQGKGSYLFGEDHFGQTTLSSGGTNPSAKSSLGQIRVGGLASYDAGGFSPFVAVYYISDAGSSHQAPVGGQNAANDDDAWQVQVGVNLYSRGPLSGGVTYSTETGRSQIKNDMIMGNISYRF